MASVAASEPRRSALVGGRYEVLGRLGAGGMAELFVARAMGIAGFEKIVALKRILPHAARDPSFIRMFLDEARLAALLDHPNVVHVYDIGRAGEDFFFTMEYIHGETVLALLAAAGAEHDGLPLAHAVHIACGVAAGLHHAHERVGTDGRPLGIIHRDVSPSNVLVNFDGTVKVVDFGIAKAALSGHDTTTGVAKGKGPYMAPEQCRGQALDRRADVWALGVMLYEMTTGVRPFRAANRFELMEEIVHGDAPPPTQVRADYPAELERIVLRALHRDPDGRYATARELQSELARFGRAHDASGSDAELADFMRELFGTKPLPWLGGATRAEAISFGVASVDAAAAPTVPARPSSRRGRVVVVAGVVALAALGVLALARSSSDDGGQTDAAIAPTLESSPPVEPSVSPAARREPPPTEASPPPTEAAPPPTETEPPPDVAPKTPAPTASPSTARSRKRPRPQRADAPSPRPVEGLFDEF